MTVSSSRVIDIVSNASQIALRQYGHERGELKKDGTIVTKTDRAIEKYLCEEYTELFNKDVHIYGEEGGWRGEDSASYGIIIDPIDGTEPFCDQIAVWGISVAVYYKGRPWVGVFSMPAANLLFQCEFGQGAHLNGQVITVPRPIIPIPSNSYLAVSSDIHHWNLQEYPAKIRALGSAGYHVALVASGALQAALLTRFTFYDIAATAIMLWEAGGNLYYLSGEMVSPDEILNVQKPKEAVLACHPDAFEETRKYIHR